MVWVIIQVMKTEILSAAYPAVTLMVDTVSSSSPPPPSGRRCPAWVGPHPEEGVQLEADIVLKESSPCFDNGGVLAMQSGGRDHLLATCPLGSFHKGG